MQIAALSPDLGSGVIAELQVFDATLNPVPATRLINGGGETAIQVHQITNGATYYLRVAAAKPGAGFDQGNYDVSIGFTDDAVQLPVIASGDLTATTRRATHSLYVAQPELFILSWMSSRYSRPPAMRSTCRSMARTNT